MSKRIFDLINFLVWSMMQLTHTYTYSSIMFVWAVAHNDVITWLVISIFYVCMCVCDNLVSLNGEITNATISQKKIQEFANI